MLKSTRVLALDIGASKVALAEFTVGSAGVPTLSNYAIGPLGIVPEGESDVSAYVVSTIRDLMRQGGIQPAPLLMTISGQAVFPRFVKLPPVTRDKVLQIVQYEAEQNVPFPIEQVVWDYQLVGGPDGETNVILVAVKTENITALTDCVQAAGMEPEVVDVAPMAIYNTVRFNYPDLTGCTMVLDMGARSSNLIFIEDTRIFSRSIPVAGNTVTQEIAKEFGIPFEEAEQLKREHGFVALGGVYAVTEDETADRVSKIVRHVVTRLHAEVNRSINFYRSQQNGSQPSLVLLTGGSSMIAHTDTFFREKLKVEVAYLNPLAHVPVNPALNRAAVQRDLPLLGPLVGLGLRRALRCPVEINLMPPDLKARKVFRSRQPFFVLSAVGVALILLCWWVYTTQMRDMVEERIRNTEERIQELRIESSALDRVLKDKQAVRSQVDRLRGLVQARSQWAEILAALHGCLLDGMWLTAVRPVETGGDLKQIEIEGYGFADKLKKVERPDATAFEVFRDRIMANDRFSRHAQETKIVTHTLPDANTSMWEFRLLVGLAKPLSTK
jgi:type IV pilus assembly protein PilM